MRSLAKPFPILLALVSGLSGQTPVQARWVTAQNLSPFGRHEWVSTVVPFRKGEVRGLPDLRAGEGPTVWQALGARWDDGSLRQAICLFPIEMQRLSEARLRLQPGNDKPLPTGLQILDPLRIGSVKLTIEAELDSRTLAGTPTYVADLESNAARRVSLYRCRVGDSGLVFELIVTTCIGQAHCYISLGLFFSDPTSERLQLPVRKILVKSRGMRLVIHHARSFGIRNELVDGGSATTLLDDAVLGDGQGIRRTGVLTPMLRNSHDRRDQTLQAAALGPIRAATNWSASAAYGPFGYVPPPPPWLTGQRLRAAMARRHAEFVRDSSRPGQAFRRLPYQLAKNPSQTGKQDDFGILKLSPVASTGVPSFLLEVERAVLQEACRPVHFFESDGAPLQIARHPKLVIWSGRPHWNCEVSPDRLGKACPQPKFFNNGWRGKDRQHWSSNFLCGYYLLTGSAWARREIDNEVQLFLASQTIRDGLATTGPGAPRAIGRMLMLGCWLYQCTGNQALLTRMQARMQKSYLPGWSGREFESSAVRPMAIKRPDGRILRGKAPYWVPWQESLAAIGFFALYRTTGDPTAQRLAEAIATNVLRHGWRIDSSGAHIGYAIRWNTDHSPLSQAELRASHPEVCKWAGGGITAWSIGAVEVARHFAKLRQDQALTTRAEHILHLLRQQHRNRPPRHGWWDDYRQWDAVR